MKICSCVANLEKKMRVVRKFSPSILQSLSFSPSISIFLSPLSSPPSSPFLYLLSITFNSFLYFPFLSLVLSLSLSLSHSVFLSLFLFLSLYLSLLSLFLFLSLSISSLLSLNSSSVLSSLISLPLHLFRSLTTHCFVLPVCAKYSNAKYVRVELDRYICYSCAQASRLISTSRMSFSKDSVQGQCRRLH